VRDEAYVRLEVRWLIERACAALDLPAEAAVGCSDDQIAQVLQAQQLAELPPALDELLRRAGDQVRGAVLGELFPATQVGWDVMLFAKEHARATAAATRSNETFGSNQAVFLSDPGGSVYWVVTTELDPLVWALSERTPTPRIEYPRLACWLEQEIVKVEVGWPSREYWTRGER
jgi:hypothetical protein